MKIRILLFTAVIASAALVSCGSKGLSEETKSKMTAFETDWKATGEAITAWGATMNTALADMHTMMEAAMPMEDAKMKAKPNAAMDSLNAVCTDIMGKADQLKAGYESALANWAADEKSYTDWKTSGKGTPDAEVVAGLEGYMTKLADYKASMETWNTTLTGLQASCKSTCDMMMSHMSM